MPSNRFLPRSENRAEENIALRHIVESPWFIGAANGTKSSAGCRGVVEKVWRSPWTNDIRIGDPNAAPPTDGGTGGYCNDYTHRHDASLE
jgi:hypothetical protein